MQTRERCGYVDNRQESAAIHGSLVSPDWRSSSIGEMRSHPQESDSPAGVEELCGQEAHS